MLKRELDNERRELRNFKTGQHANGRENVEREMTADGRITHERAGHATYDPRCETCVKVRGMSTHPRKAVAEAAYLDYAGITISQQGAEVKILDGAGPRGETFARAVHLKGATFEDLEQFLKVLQTRYGNIPVYLSPRRMLARSCTQYGRTTWDPNRECQQLNKVKQMDVQNNECER